MHDAKAPTSKWRDRSGPMSELGHRRRVDSRSTISGQLSTPDMRRAATTSAPKTSTGAPRVNSYRVLSIGCLVSAVAAPYKKAPDNAGALFRLWFRIRLVARTRRSTELVVEARGEEIDILLDMVGDEEAGG